MTERLQSISEKKWFVYLSLALGGIMTALTLAYPGIGILGWIALVPAAYTILRLVCDRAVRLRTLYYYGFFFFTVFYLVIYHWLLYLYPLSFLGIDSERDAFFIVVGAWVGLSLFQTVGASFLFVLFGALARTEIVKKIRFMLPFLAAALWVALEWAQTLGSLGVPWARLSIGQTEMPFMVQSVSLFGTYFITFILVAVNFLIAYALLFGEKKRLCALLSAGIFVFNLALGATLYYTYKAPEEYVKVSAIQGNFAAIDKRNGSSYAMFNAYCSLTRDAVEDGAKIVVWPETAVTVKLLKNEYMTGKITALARECDVTLIVGTFTEDEESGMKMNSMVLINPDGSVSDTVYSKRHLVPFGEFIPFRDAVLTILPFVGRMMSEDVKAGDDSYVFDTEYGKIGSIICFDSIYENVTRDSVKNGARVISLGTNDSWFGDSAGLGMHHAQAKLRAIESGRYILRAGNTGITSIITPRGEVATEIDIFVQDKLMGEIGFLDTVTLYSIIGNTFAYLSLAFIVGVLGHDAVLKICNKAKEKKQNASPAP